MFISILRTWTDPQSISDDSGANVHTHPATGDSASILSVLSRLSVSLQEHPYSRNVEEVIYLLAVGQSTFPTTEQGGARANGALEYLEYLRESYASARQGASTVMLYPRWDTTEKESDLLPQSLPGERVQETSGGHGGGLVVDGLPVWALQFQIGLLAFRLGLSARAMAAMENSFLCYETWLPRSEDARGSSVIKLRAQDVNES